MRRIDDAPLTVEQKRLVEASMGLVGANLKRFGRGSDPPRSHREREDLFQEGCLALMRAARTYPANCPVPFAAYALPRIRNAMNFALQRGFSSVKVPLRRRGKAGGRGEPSEMDRHRPYQVMAGDFDFTSQEDKRRHDPSEPDVEERIGDCMRDRYDRAVRHTVERMHGVRDKRGDLKTLVDQLTEDRLTLPSEEARVSLREIAVRTKSSYARVHKCEQRMLRLVREMLDRDLIFCSARNEAMRHDQGVNAPLDDQLRRRIRVELEREFMDQYRIQEHARRWSALARLVELSPTNELDLVRDLLSTLSDSAFESLLDEWTRESTVAASQKLLRSTLANSD